MYRLYLFDFDYTLVNSEQGILGCFHRTIDAWHLPPVTDDTIRKTIGLPMEQAVEIITGIHDAADIDRFIDDYRKDADIHMTPGTHFSPTRCRRSAPCAKQTPKSASSRQRRAAASKKNSSPMAARTSSTSSSAAKTSTR